MQLFKQKSKRRNLYYFNTFRIGDKTIESKTKDIMKSHYKTVSIILLVSINLFGCKKLVTDPAPSTSINSNNVYTDDQTTAAVLTGIYTQIMQSNNLTNSSFINASYYCGLSADELTLWGGSTDAVSAGF